jgi:hypothetical protein
MSTRYLKFDKVYPVEDNVYICSAFDGVIVSGD